MKSKSHLRDPDQWLRQLDAHAETLPEMERNRFYLAIAECATRRVPLSAPVSAGASGSTAAAPITVAEMMEQDRTLLMGSCAAHVLYDIFEQSTTGGDAAQVMVRECRPGGMLIHDPGTTNQIPQSMANLAQLRAWIEGAINLVSDHLTAAQRALKVPQ
jgi:hypothetical protein